MVLTVSLTVFAGLWAANVTLPGPNFVRVSSAALNGSRRLAFITSLGTASGNALWCLLAALVAAWLMRNPVLATALRIAGAGYFAWYALSLLLRTWRSPVKVSESGTETSAGRAFWNGAVTALANPQTAIFFSTALASTFALLDSSSVLAASAAVAAITSIWYALVVAILSAPASRTVYMRMRRPLECAFAGVIALAAAKLVVIVL